MNYNLNRRPVIAATVASCLMLVSGLIYHAIAARLPVTTITAPIASDALEQFPMQINDWTGQDTPLDETLILKTGTDAHINRRYSRGYGSESVLIYVACGTDIYHLISHRPEICYVGAGWILRDRRSVDLELCDKTKLLCSILEFSRSGLYTERISILYYFIADGQYCSDFSAVRSRAGYRLAEIHYVTQVQIVASTATLTEGSAKRLICDFAVDSALAIAGLLENLEDDWSSGESGNTTKGK